MVVDPGAAAGADNQKASGGVITDYTSPPGTVYRAHVFNNSGTFTVESPALTSVE